MSLFGGNQLPTVEHCVDPRVAQLAPVVTTMRLEGGFPLEAESLRDCPASVVVPIYVNLTPAAPKPVDRKCGQALGRLCDLAPPDKSDVKPICQLETRHVRIPGQEAGAADDLGFGRQYEQSRDVRALFELSAGIGANFLASPIPKGAFAQLIQR